MSHDLYGRTILIVGDEPLLALDIAQACERRGAVGVPAHSLATAKNSLENGGVSGAVVDFVLGHGHADALCCELERRCTPFILHSGSDVTAAHRNSFVVAKPGLADALLDALGRLLNSRRCIDAVQAKDEIERLRETTQKLSDDLASDRARTKHWLAKSDRLMKSSNRKVTESRALLERLAKTNW